MILFSIFNSTDEGGELTLFLTGKLSRPKKEPIYSGGDRTQYPITSGYQKVSYNDYLSGHLKNNKNILISQNMCNKKFSGIFAPTKLYNSRPAMSWGIRSSYDGFSDYVDEQWEMNKKIYSLACDEDLGFGCYFMDKYGDGQSIVTKTSNIKEKWDQGMYNLRLFILHSYRQISFENIFYLQVKKLPHAQPKVLLIILS